MIPFVNQLRSNVRTGGNRKLRAKILVPVLSIAMAAGADAVWAQDAAAIKYPLAAKAGVDSYADKIAPPGAVNQGPFDINTWKRGHAWDAPVMGSPIWNPVKLKMMQGGEITMGGMIGPDPAGYCAVANSGVDIT